MPMILKRNALIAFGLAALFYWAFMFAKHDLSLRDVIPFGVDPYDAVGSFGCVVGMLVASVSLVRAFRPYRKEPPSVAERIHLVRSQLAVVLTVLGTLVADAIAMARHPLQWINSASRNELIALLGGLAIVAIIVQLLIHASQQNLPKTGSTPWKRVTIAILLPTLILVFFPEQLINNSLLLHLLTVILAAFLLFAPMRLLLPALVPYKLEEAKIAATRARCRFAKGGLWWGTALLLGVVIGAFALLGEMSEGSLPVGRAMLVASVFIGLGIAGILTACACLGKPLGLEPRD